MAQCKLSAQDFIKNAFTPCIGVFQTESVDQITLKNNLSFIELLQPFSKLNIDAHIQDANGGTIVLHNFQLAFSDINIRPPVANLTNQILNTCVSYTSEPHTEKIQAGSYNLQIPAPAMWFDAWRSLFLKLQCPSDHEFTKHYLACILVVSSADNDPIEMMNQLGQNLNQLQVLHTNKSPKWFNSTVLRYYCILHDNREGDLTKATQTLETFKVAYGPSNCFLLQLNSATPVEGDHSSADPWKQFIFPYYRSFASNRWSPDASPSDFRSSTTLPETSDATSQVYHPLSPTNESTKLDSSPTLESTNQSSNIPHGTHLTTGDIEQIKFFIQEFCTKALLPYVERLIQNLNDLVTHKKGVGKSLFSATKRWFSPGKMGSTGSNLNLLIYPYEAPELQFRRLGDLYFMFGHYSLAYQVYHACKQDFSADQAWLYYAGVLEMASLAAFMTNEPTRKSFDYMEEAITTYLNTCRIQHFAARATLFSTECLKARNLYGEAAHQFIRMTSEDSDLRSALFLEQAAFCFLEGSRPQMVRKYAFHMVLSGHRFSKSAQKKHALRCYKQALQVYSNSQWAFAEDHVHYTIGKLSMILNNYEEAIKSFALLLTIQSKQSVEQQTLFLEEYLSIQRMLSKDATHISVLLLPMLKCDTLKILVGPTPPLTIPRKVRALGVSFDSHENPVETQMWNKLEEMIIQEAQGSIPITFKAAVVLYTKHNIPNTKISAVVNELIQVSIVVHNPLLVPLILQDIYLLWEFTDVNGTVSTNDKIDKSNLLLKTHPLKSFLAQSNSSQDLILSVTPLIVGELRLKGISYSIYNSYNSEDIVFITGKQYFDVQQLGLTEKDTFKIHITPPAPCLQVTFSEIRTDSLCCEIQPIQMEIRNAGHLPLNKIYIATSKPQYLSMCDVYGEMFKFKESVGSDAQSTQDREVAKNHVYPIPLPNKCLQSGQSHLVNLWLKTPNYKGHINIDLLIYYESSDSNNDLRYRLIRHTWKLNIFRSLEVILRVIEGSNSQNVQEILFLNKVTNTCKPQNLSAKISIVSVTLLSSYWKLVSLGKCTKSIALNSKQSTQVLLKGLRCMTDDQKYYEISLDTDEIFKTEIMHYDFGRRHGLKILNTFESTNFGVSSQVEGVFLFHWIAEVTNSNGLEYKTNGQTCVRLERTDEREEKPCQDSNSIKEISFTESPLTEIGQETASDSLHIQIAIRMESNDFVYHDFKKKNICIIPIKIIMYNDAPVNSAVTINRINTVDVASCWRMVSHKPSLFDVHPSKKFWWIGINTVEISILPLSSEKTVFYIAVTTPGVYDLGSRLEVWCKNDLHSDKLLQIVHISNFITVKNFSN